MAVVGLLLVGCAGIRPPRGVKPLVVTMTTTGYCKCGDCCGWHRNWYGRPTFSSGPLKGRKKPVGITANGTRVRRGTLAADTSRFPFGTVMQVPGYGYGVVEDRGGEIRGAHIDLYFPTHREALKWGRRTTRVRVWPADG